MRKPIRLGIIGCGLMGREIASAVLRYPHLPETTALPSVVAVCDHAPDRMQWFTDNIPTVSQATTDFRELLANPHVDAIYAAVPHQLHHIIYPAVIESGKALLGEKPFGIDIQANDQILNACSQHPEVVVRSASEFPYFPGAVQLVDLVTQGQLGRLIEVEAGFWHSSDWNPDKPINWKRQVATNGAYGCMGDLGLHVVHLPIRLGIEFHRVYAQLTNVITQRPGSHGAMEACDTWDNAYLQVSGQYSGAMVPLTLTTKRIMPGHANTWFIRVVGTQGAAEFSTQNPKVLRQIYRDASNASPSWQWEEVAHRSVFSSVTGSIFEFGFSDAILQMLAAFLEEVVGANVPALWRCVSPEETHLSHQLFTAALQSQADGAPIDIAMTVTNG